MIAKKHIAWLLAGILMSPFLLQSLHIVHHHGHHDSGHVCTSDHSQPEQASTTVLLDADSLHDNCYICDFKLPVNDIPVITGADHISVRLTELESPVIFSLVIDDGYNRVCPRGPPSLS